MITYVEALDNWDGRGMSVFLGGGISGCSDWQKQVVEMIRAENIALVNTEDLSDLDIVLINPRRANFPINDPTAAAEQIKWEHDYLMRADAILFWFAPETLCPITLFELGTFARTNVPIFVGADPKYQRRQDVQIQMSLYREDVEVVDSLESLVSQVKKWITTHDPKQERIITTRLQYLTAVQYEDSLPGQGYPTPPSCGCRFAGAGTCRNRPGWIRRVIDFFKLLFAP